MKTKILFLSHKFNPDVGGIESHSEILVQAIASAGYEVHLLTWSAAKAGGQEFTFQIIRNPDRGTIIREHLWADLVIENNPSIRLGWPNLFLPRPKIMVIHTWISNHDGKVRWVDKLKKAYLSKSVNVIACSDAIRRKSYPDALVIDNPYNSSLFKLLPAVNRDKDFVFLGRLVSDKGASILIKAFSRLLESNKDAYAKLTLTIIGNGPEKDNLLTLVNDLGLTNNVQFTGTLTGEALVTTLNEHKYIAVPSVWEEPFGMVALEGMACGCLPIVTNGGGLADAVGAAGLIVTRGDVNAFAAGMQELLTNTKLEQELRSHAAVHLARHTPGVITAEYLKVIEMAVGGN